MNFPDQYNIFITARFHLLAAAVLALGACIRLRRFSKKGLFLWDEATYLREVMAADYILKFYRKRWKEMIALKLKPDAARREALVEEYKSEKIYDYVWYKVWHTALTYLSYRVIKPADLAMAVPSFVIGAAGIILAIWMGRLIGGDATGLMAGLCLALGGMHTLHSRSAEPEVGAATCIQAAALCSLLHKLSVTNGGAAPVSPALLAACGFFLCGASMFNPAWIMLAVPITVLTEAVYAVAANTGFAAFAVSVSVILASVLASAVLVNVPFFINGFLFPEDGVKTSFHRYSQWLGTSKSVFKVFGDKKEKGEFYGAQLNSFHRLLFYPDLLMKTEGPAVFAAAAGAALMFFRAGPAGAFLAAYAVLIFGALTASSFKSSRAITAITPFLAVFAGYFLGASLPAAAALPIALLIAAWGTRMGWRIGNLTSGIRLAAEYIHSKGYDDFLCTSAPFSAVYGSRKHMYTVPCRYEAIIKMFKENNNVYLIVDFHELFPSMLQDKTISIIQKYIEPELIYEDACVTFYPLLAESEFLSSTLKVWDTDNAFGTPEQLSVWNSFRMNPSEKDRTVRVYNITPLLSPEAGGPFFHDLQIMQIEKMLMLGNDKKEILEALRGFLCWYPDDRMGKYYIGITYHNLGRHEMAARYLREVARDEGADMEIRRKCGGLLSSYELYLRKSELVDNQSLNELSYLVEQGLVPEDLMQKAVERIFTERETLLFEAKEHAQALAAAEERLSSAPGCPRAGFFKALALRALGRTEESRCLFRSLLAAGILPDDLKAISEQLAR